MQTKDVYQFDIIDCMLAETQTVSRRGGKRPGAGRKPGAQGPSATKMYVRQLLDRPLPNVRAHNVLDLVNEAQLWARLLGSDDERVVMNSLMYLTDRRDGKPTQNINMQSINVNISAEQIARARQLASEIACELAGEQSVRRLQPGEHQHESASATTRVADAPIGPVAPVAEPAYAGLRPESGTEDGGARS